MNLLERARRITGEIRDVENLDERTRQADLFEARATQLTVPIEGFNELTASMKLVSSQGIVLLSLDSNLVGSLRSRIMDLKVRYAQDKNVMIEPFPGEDARQILIKPLGKLPAQAKDALQLAWEKWAREKLQLPENHNDILTILGRITALRASVSSIRNLISDAERICKQLPDNDDVVVRIMKLGSEISVAWQNLAGEGIPDQVLDFLRATGSASGAAYNALTPEVLKWLSDHELQNALRIRMG